MMKQVWISTGLIFLLIVSACSEKGKSNSPSAGSVISNPRKGKVVLRILKDTLARGNTKLVGFVYRNLEDNMIDSVYMQINNWNPGKPQPIMVGDTIRF